ncbi:MAG: ABC transporter permease [Cyclobacteriaceae bacterium]
MLRNYLVTAFRNLRRNKIYTALNILGLALGIGCALVIFKVISYETSFNIHEENYDKIYRIVNENIYPDRSEKGMGTPHPLGPAVKEEFPEILEVVRTQYLGGDQLNITDGGELKKFLIEEGIMFTEPGFFKIFSVKWVAGDAENPLDQPNTVILTRSAASLLFGLPEERAAEAIQRTVNYGNIKDFIVTGVVEDPIEPTSIPYKFIFEYNSQKGEISPYYDPTQWNSTSSATNTYILTDEHFSQKAFDSKMLDFVEKYRGEGESEKIRYTAQPFSDIAFDDEYGNYAGATSKEFLIALGIIGLFLVLTASINFVNLATAQASNRAKEIGVRKAIGGMSSQLVVQFLSEIAMITFFAVIISLAISEIMFNLLQDIIGYQLSVDVFGSATTLLFLIGIFLIVTLLSGFYPAILLSRMNAIDALKKRINGKTQTGLSLRKGLVTLQFAISQFLIVGTLIVSSQTDFFLNKELGFDTEAIFTSYLPERDSVKMMRFKTEMLSSPAIEAVSFNLSEPTGNSNSKSNFNYAPLESKNSYHANFKAVDEDFIDLFGLEILAGEPVRPDNGKTIVVNEKVAKLMGFEGRYDEVIGETLSTGWGGDKRIIGVVKDFHTYTLEEELDFVILMNYYKAFYSISIRATSIHALKEATNHYERSWERVYPEFFTIYDFYDENLAENYQEVQNVTLLLRIFAIISILIGCFGLYGLISFMAMNKTKEIGVRKVLGASTFSILSIFSKEVLVLMTVAFMITTPVAIYYLGMWLDTFAYSIEMGPEFFAVAFGATLLIAITTISHKTITTALINPADTLKDD